MTRETRIAMLVGLLFIIMFGLVISDLTGYAGSSSPLKARGDESLSQRYAPVRMIDPPPPGDVPAEAMPPGESRPPVEVAGGGRDSGPSSVEVVIVPRPTERPAEPARPRDDSPVIHPIETSAPSPAPATAGEKYVVKPKDTLIKIARAKYGLDGEKMLAMICSTNRIGKNDIIQVGQELVLPPAPGASPVPSASPAPSPTPRAAIAISTPAPIPYREMTAEEIRRALLPAVTPLPSSSPAGVASERTGESSKQYYTVRRGDSLAKIAKTLLHDDSRAAVQKLIKANKDKLRDPDELSVGMKLEIPT